MQVRFLPASFMITTNNSIASANKLYLQVEAYRVEARETMIYALQAALECGNILNNLPDDEDGVFAGGMEVAGLWMLYADRASALDAPDITQLYREIVLGKPSEPPATVRHSTVLESTPHDSADIDGAATESRETPRSDSGDGAADGNGKQTHAATSPVATQRVKVKRVKSRNATLPTDGVKLPWDAAHAAAHQCRQAMIALKNRITQLCRSHETAPLANGQAFVSLLATIDAADGVLKLHAPAYACPLCPTSRASMCPVQGQWMDNPRTVSSTHTRT